MQHHRVQFPPFIVNSLVILFSVLLCSSSAVIGAKSDRCLNFAAVGPYRKESLFIQTVLYRRAQSSGHAVVASAVEAAEPIFTEAPWKAPPPLEPVAELLSLKQPQERKKLTKDIKKAHLDWACREIRRFTYKLGTANKQMRRLVEKYNVMRNTFTCSKEDLSRIRQAKREVAKKLRIVSRLRRLFIVYKNGISDNVEPNVPYVPLKYRSSTVPKDFYVLGKRKYHDARCRKLKQEKKPQAQRIEETPGTDNTWEYYKYLEDGDDPYGLYDSVNESFSLGNKESSSQLVGKSENCAISQRKQEPSVNIDQENYMDGNTNAVSKTSNRTIKTANRSQSRKADIEAEILGLIATARNQAIHKKRLVNDVTIAKLQAKLRNSSRHRMRIPKGL